jgi:sigma-B regulation protein RsbU (phosphoserine phosphatase)
MWDIETTTALLRQMSETADDPHKLLQLILTNAQRAFKVQRAIVLSRDGLEYPRFRVLLYAECDPPFPRAGTNVDDSNSTRAGGLLADLLYAGQFRGVTPLVFDDTEPSRAFFEGCRSLAAFPLYDHGESVGMVVLLGPTDRDCSAPELCGLAILGSLLRRADRAHDLTKRLEATCRALDAELAAAASVQRWLLPPSGPPVPGVGTAALYRTAQQAGGDYYDAGELPDGNFGVLIADVSGHGAAAAVLMAILRTIVHDEVDRSQVVGPAALLDHADDRLCALGLSSRGWFVTAFSASLDTATGEFRYSCAGHPPPRLLRARDRTEQSLNRANTLPLGVLDERPARTEETVMLEPGDTVVFYSDGITEAKSPEGEFFGVSRLDQVLRELPQAAPPEAAVNAIETAVADFMGTAALLDDQTLLIVRWQGATVTHRLPSQERPGHAER